LLYVPPDSSEKDIKAAEMEQVASEAASEDPTADLPSATSAEPGTTATQQALAANDPDPHHYLIRARQGHSIKTIDTASLLQQLSLEEGAATPLPETVVHGTFHASWPKILDSGGLKCMGRTHIHFASGPPLSAILPQGLDGPVAQPPPRGAGKDKDGVISGMRGDAQILIYINIKRALAAGCPFWISENGVILSEGMGTDDGPEKVIPLEFFDVVVERKNGLGVLWENGRLIQETPQWMLKAKAPAGKGERGGKGGKGGHQKAAPRLKVEKEMDYGYP
jgi:2'-phosphotransferase